MSGTGGAAGEQRTLSPPGRERHGLDKFGAIVPAGERDSGKVGILPTLSLILWCSFLFFLTIFQSPSSSDSLTATNSDGFSSLSCSLIGDVIFGVVLLSLISSN